MDPSENEQQEAPASQSSAGSKAKSAAQAAAKLAIKQGLKAAAGAATGGAGTAAIMLAEAAKDPQKAGKNAVLIAILLIIFLFLIIYGVYTLLFDDAKPAPACVPPPVPSNEQTAGTDPAKYRLTHEEATQQLQAAGISWSSSGNCSDKDRKDCTSFTDILQSTITGIIQFKQDSGANLVITGGTETGHANGAYSHGNGYKIDISSDGNADKQSYYIKNKLKYLGSRQGDHGGPGYRDENGNEYVFETRLHHWDITFMSVNPCGNIPPSDNDCSSKYADDMKRNRFNTENWGDPACDFNTGDMDKALQELDRIRWEKWHSVIKGESGLNPLAWADPGIGTPNPYGAWGLLQMGSKFQSNNQFDRGDVEWKSQLVNAFQYLHNSNKNDPYKYWCQWNKLFPEGDGLGHVASRPNCR